jgi:hypothetical protein
MSIVVATMVAQLEKRRDVIIADLLGKVDVADWHGVADAAMDLREVYAVLKALELLEPRA